MRDESSASTVDVTGTGLAGAPPAAPRAAGGPTPLARGRVASDFSLASAGLDGHPSPNGAGVGADGDAAAALPRVHIRLWRGMRHPANWWQLIRFSIVGASGFAVNLVLYDVAYKDLGIHYLVAEALAWVLAGANNFVWNRHWTFRAREGQIHVQAIRFLLVSLVALGLNLLVLRALVEAGGVDKLFAEVLALAISTPANFLGNKLWSFKLDLYSEALSEREE
jgi:putative flippase GtrA